jgi:hypothetical protein
MWLGYMVPVLWWSRAGKLAYERGQYESSVGFLEQAVEKAGKTSIAGGEAQMWLALAYQVR